MINLTFIIAHDKTHLIASAFDFLEEVLQESGLQYNVRKEQEEMVQTGLMSDGNPIPQNSIVYVHGNYGDNYKNIGRTRTLASQRPDLRFILYINPKYTNSDFFANRDDIGFVREKLFSGPSPKEIVSISPHYPVSFFGGRAFEGSMKPIDDHLENYLKEWKQLREAQP